MGPVSHSVTTELCPSTNLTIVNSDSTVISNTAVTTPTSYMLQEVQPLNTRQGSSSLTSTCTPNTTLSSSSHYPVQGLKPLNGLRSPSSTANTTITTSFSLSDTSKLLYSMDPTDLALIVKYTMDNEALFEKFKHESNKVHEAFIDFKIKGKMIRNLTSVEFAEELPWVRRDITIRLHMWLKLLTDDDIITILHNVNNITIPEPDILVEDSTTDSISITASSCDRKYNRDIVDQLVALGYGTERECIQASSLTTHYHDINEVLNTLTRSHPLDQQSELYRCDANIFQVFVYLVCTDNGHAIHRARLVRGIMQMGMNGKDFMSIKRIDFIHGLKEYNIKRGVASNVYRLIMTNRNKVSVYFEKNNYNLSLMATWSNDTLNAVEIAEVTAANFESDAHRLLECINEKMEINMVNGRILAQYYQSKVKLEMYLKQNVRHKSVNLLVDMLWNNYIRDRKKEISRIKMYNREQLMKYIESLYIDKVKSVIINTHLNEDKFKSMKRTSVCGIFIRKCIFTAGVSTNIVDSISRGITESQSQH